MNVSKPVRIVTTVALCAALGAVLSFLETPIVFLGIPGFYKLDPSDLPALLCGFAVGPLGGVLCELLKTLLKLLIRGSSTLGIGDFGNFVIASAMILPASLLYKFKRTKGMACVGLLLGIVCMVLVGSLMNAYVLFPLYAAYMNMPTEAVIAMGSKINSHITDLGSFILWAVVPFNLIKGTLLALITLLIYKPLRRIFTRKD